MIIVDSEPPPFFMTIFLRVVSRLRKTIYRCTGVRTHGIRCMRPTLYLLHHSRLQSVKWYSVSNLYNKILFFLKSLIYLRNKSHIPVDFRHFIATITYIIVYITKGLHHQLLKKKTTQRHQTRITTSKKSWKINSISVCDQFIT